MRVLVTGANGFIGRALCARLAASENMTVRAAVRRGQGDLPGTCEFVDVGEIDGATEWSAVLQGVDAIVHLAGRAHVASPDTAGPPDFHRVNVEGTRRLAEEATRAGVGRFVFVSSIGVNGQMTAPGRRLRADEAPAPQCAYAESKLGAERALSDVLDGTETERVVVRPPLVIGPEAPGNFRRLAKLVRAGWPLPFGLIRNERAFIGIDNLVDFLVTCLTKPAARGTHVVADDGHFSTPALVRVMARAAGTRVFIVPVPVPVLRSLAMLTGRRYDIERLIGSLRVDDGPTRTALRWRPPLSPEESIRVAMAPASSTASS